MSAPGRWWSKLEKGCVSFSLTPLSSSLLFLSLSLSLAPLCVCLRALCVMLCCVGVVLCVVVMVVVVVAVVVVEEEEGDKSNHLVADSHQSFLKIAETEHLYQVKRMIGGIGNTLCSICFSTENGNIHGFLWTSEAHDNPTWALLVKQNWRWPSRVLDSKTPPCVHSERPRVWPATRAHVEKHVRVLPATHGDVLNVHTEAFFESTHGVVSVPHHTPHSTYTHHGHNHGHNHGNNHSHNITYNITLNITRRQRDRDKRETEKEREERRRKRRDRTRQEKRKEDKRKRMRRRQDKRRKRRPKKIRQDKTKERRSKRRSRDQQKMKRERWNEMKEVFCKQCLRTLEPARWTSSKCFEKIPFGRIILLFLGSLESYRVFNNLHDSSSNFRARWKNSEILSGGTVFREGLNMIKIPTHLRLRTEIQIIRFGQKMLRQKAACTDFFELHLLRRSEACRIRN